MNQQLRVRISGPLLEVVTPTVGEDGLVPHDQWTTPLPVEVPNSESIVEGCVIELVINSAPGGSKHTVLKSEADDPDFRFNLSLDLGDTSPPFGNPAVSVRLNYTVFNPETNVTSSSPFTHTVTFDKQPPGAVPLPHIIFQIDTSIGVLPSDIVEGDFVGEVAAWPHMAVGDVLTGWLSATAPESCIPNKSLLPGTQVIIAEGEVGHRVAVRFPEAALVALGDVDQHFGYQLKDKQGNTSEISQTRPIPVHLSDPVARQRSAKKQPPLLPRVVRPRLADDELFAPTIPGLRPSDGRLKLTDLTKPIVVTFVLPPLPVSGAESQIYINGYEAANAIGTAVPVPDGATSFDLTIATTDFPPDAYPFVEWSVDYSYADPFNDPNFSYKPVTILFDRSAPGGLPPKPGPIAFTDEQLEGIGPDDLDPAKQGLVVKIAAWNDEDIDDQPELWLGASPTSGAYLADKPAAVTQLGSGVEAVFLQTELEKFNTNPVWFGYRVTDWAGNVSQLSDLVAIDLFLRDIPSNLLAPLVPEAEAGSPPGSTAGLLVWNEAFPSTTVRIPLYDNVKAGDRIYIKWNTSQNIPPVTVQQTDIDGAATNGFLLEVEVPSPFIQDGSPGPNIPVSYQVFPANNGPAVTSPDALINVDLSTPGGPDPDPDPTTPEHDNLLPLSVLSTLAGSVANVIPADAFELAANITIRRLGVDNQPIYQAGDIVDIYWGPDHTDDPASLTLDAPSAGSNLIIPLPAGFIKNNGTGDIEVYYTLSRDLGGGNLVTVASFKTIVIVHSPDEAPGGPAPLAQAVFPESRDPVSANPYRFVRRADGLNGTTLRIPLKDANGPLANVAPGDKINIEFYGVNDPLDGAGHDNDPARPQIPESVIKPPAYSILQADLDLGYYELALPYSKLYYICYNLSVTKYSITNKVATKNAPETYILFALASPGVACSLP